MSGRALTKQTCLERGEANLNEVNAVLVIQTGGIETLGLTVSRGIGVMIEEKQWKKETKLNLHVRKKNVFGIVRRGKDGGQIYH